MASEALPAPAPKRRASLAARIALWAAVGLAGLIALVALLLVAIDTGPGRRFVAGQLDGLELASGLRIGIGSLEGSLYGELTVRNLTLGDPKGEFFSAPEVALDWRPFAYLRNHVDIRSARLPTARLRRLPELRPSEDPDAPMLPDIDISLGRLEVGRLRIDPPVSGETRLVSLSATAHIADRRAQIDARAATLQGRGIAGGDRLLLRLDAVPEDNRLDIEARLDAPRGGMVAGMTGLDQPLRLTVDGKGDWANWSGRARTQLGERSLANLAIRARDGTFRITGPLQPQLIVRGPVERLAAPAVQLDLTATLDERRADTRLSLQSDALLIRGAGLIDLGRSRFGDLRLAARLLQPGAVAPNLSARDATLTLALNGPFATPRVAYRLQAAAIGFNGTVVERLQAQGAARVDADRIMVPVSARAARVSGLNPAFGGLLTNVAIDGNLAISGPKILSDDLRIRSDKIDATAIIVADVARGEYNGALQGRVNNYLVRGIGLLDITTNMDLVSNQEGFGISGRVAIQTRRIDNSTARDFLGGNALVTANVGMTPAGIFTLDNLRVRAPGLSISGGSGRYGPGDRIRFEAAGTARSYGPFSIDVTGTTTAPVVRLRAARPGLGIGLTDVDAVIRGSAAGFVVSARGQSQYGPFTADLTILTGTGPLTFDIRRLTFAGLDFSGRIAQSAAGPFVGTLTMTGSGLNGSVRLSAQGRIQRADVDANANGARIPGEVPILIQRGLIRATAILYPEAPSIVADAQFAGVRSGDLLVRTARARVNYVGGRGTVQLTADGSSGMPFRIAVNSEIAPDRIRAAVRGTVNRIDFRLERPAEIRRAGNVWELAPTTIVTGQGNARIAGRFGDGYVLQARLDSLDLAILNAFSPTLGIGGRATGSIDLVQPAGDGLPRGEARITVADFTRTGVAVRSDPVNLATVARMDGEAANAAVAIRRGGALIGRAQARLQPLGNSGGLMERLLAAPLSGGIRYNGPAEVLWSLTGIADQQLTGPIGVAADFGGRLDHPQLNGVLRANALRYDHEAYGTRITNIALQGRFTSSRLEITQLTGRAGDGTVSGQGHVDFAASSGFPIDFRLTLNRARLARSDALGAIASGTIAITNSAEQGARISGDLRLPELRYQVIHQGSAEVAELSGVRRKGEPLPDPQQSSAGSTAPSIWNLDLRIRADNQVYVSGMGLESEWRADLRVRGTSSSPIVTGTAQALRGTYSFGGRRFEIDKGEIRFTGAQPIDPTISLSASTTVDSMTAIITVSGTATMPQIALSSTPALPQDEILARLFFGNSVTELSATQALQLAASLNALSGGGGGLNPLGKLRAASGLDRLRLLGADEATGRGTAIAAGVHISNDIFVEVITDARGFTATQIEVALSRSLSILSQVSSFGSSSVNLRYSKDY